MKKANNNYKLKRKLKKQKNTKNKIIIVLTLVSILTLIVLISTSYSAFVVEGESTQETYVTGNLSVSFNDENGNVISINPAKPVSDSYGMKTDPYTFKITNTGDFKATYKIILTDEVISNPSGLTNQEVKSNIKYMLNEFSPKLLSELDSDNNLTGVIEPGQTITFDLRMWIKREANNDIENTSYSAKIGVTAKSIAE